MKWVAGVIGSAALAAALVVYIRTYTPAAGAPLPPPAARIASAVDHSDSARLSQQIEDMQRGLAALREQVAAQQRQSRDEKSTLAGAPGSAEVESPEAQRAADLERHRTYMEGVGQAFANEKVDPAWAARASARIGATFEGDPLLKGLAHSVECRQQTCRVQIPDDGSVNGRLPRLAIGMADMLSAIAAERIDQGDGHHAMVLYMFSQSPAPPSGGLPKH